MKTIYVFLLFLLGIILIVVGFLNSRLVFFCFLGGMLVGFFGMELGNRSLKKE